MSDIALASPAPASKLRGSNTLLMGPPGAGKTTALATLVEAGLEVGVIVTDPGGEESLIDAMERRKLPLSRLHTKYIAAASQSWQAMIEVSKKITLMGYKDLSDMKTGIEKSQYNQFFDLLSALADFTDDVTGESLGAVDTWQPDRAIVIDSLSGVNLMAMKLMIGGKPTAHMGEWGVAMSVEEELINKLCSDTRAFFVLTAHIDKEMDEVIGKPQFMVAALGRKLAPKLPRLFSDVVLARKEGDKFFWSTTAMDVDLKARTLPLSDRLDPSFKLIVDGWKRRNQASLSTPTK